MIEREGVCESEWQRERERERERNEIEQKYKYEKKIIQKMILFIVALFARRNVSVFPSNHHQGS